jgi:hypothetical protein
VVLALLALGSRAQDGSPEADVAKPRVLLVNTVGTAMTHSHLGVTAFSTSDRALEGNWGIDATARDAATGMLENAGYDVVPADAASVPAKMYRADLLSWTAKPALTAEFSTWLRSRMQEADAPVAVVLDTYGRNFAPNLYVQYSGYGVMSVHGDPPKHAWVFANVRALGWSRDSAKPLPLARFRDTDCRAPVDVASLGSSSFKDWTADTLAAYKPALEDLVRRRIRQDLTAAGLLQGNVEKCVLPRP